MGAFLAFFLFLHCCRLCAAQLIPEQAKEGLSTAYVALFMSPHSSHVTWPIPVLSVPCSGEKPYHDQDDSLGWTHSPLSAHVIGSKCSGERPYRDYGDSLV